MYYPVGQSGDRDAGPAAADAARQKRVWAERRLTGAQVAILCGLLGVLLLLFAVSFRFATALVIGGAVIASSIHLGLRVLAWTVGQWPIARPALTRSDADLPLYTILVPLYREANMIAALAAAMEALDYPRERLEVLLVVESDDEETQAAIARTALPNWMRTLAVPAGFPRTKPRACGHALEQARGEFVVVFDAEDRPEPTQLREAVAAFDAYGPPVACLQARLVPYNRSDTFLTRLFTLDYCQWFDGMLTGLQRLRFPVPLGGTSNHFRTAALVAAGGWDAYNVTEDADLGIRLWRLGWGVRTIGATTFEEAPTSLDSLLPQRTRWSRGYLQTFFVHARRPRTLGLPGLGVAGWFFLLAFVGGSIIFALVNPLFWAMAAYALFTGEGLLEWAFDPVIATVAWGSMVFGNGAAVLMAALSPLGRGWWRLAPWALASPIYWALVSVASYLAIAAFARDPFRWEKTPHGRTRASNGEPPR
ncbi:hypothetical protein sos41_20600 [Alphaproteobacteria bacterium SO-S41]|nr:hypothetical protein sos41_20600 [Alphaproteobacteria bacterium SO-S41]